eukprot:s345_g1.t1
MFLKPKCYGNAMEMLWKGGQDAVKQVETVETAARRLERRREQAAHANPRTHEDVKTAPLSEQDLMQQSKYIRPLILGKVRNAGLPEYGKELNDITRDEAEAKGWLKGPLDEQMLASEVGEHWLPVERFAVRQRNKLRPIDNFSTNKVNQACPEKLDLHALDQLAWLVSVFYKCVVDKGFVDLTLSDGQRLCGNVHCEWKSSNSKCLLTTLDLKDAYKQLGVHGSDRNKAVVTLRSDRHDGVDCYAMNCLPFGAASSVHNFNRVARLLWAIGVVLGVNVDCSSVCDLGELRYVMKESRRLEILECIENILKDKSLIPFNLPSILGRVQFADGQLTGRAGRLAMADIREVGLTSKERVMLEKDTLDALEFLKMRFMDNTPKTMSLRCDDLFYFMLMDPSNLQLRGTRLWLEECWFATSCHAEFLEAMSRMNCWTDGMQQARNI